MSRRRPDTVTSSATAAAVKSEPVEYDLIADGNDGDDDDPIIRSIDVYLSSELSDTLHLLQFPIEPTANNNRQGDSNSNKTPTEAKFRPRHNMLELEYETPHSANGGHRQMSDKMCLQSRTYTSNSITPVTHMALGKLNQAGTRMDIVPLQKSILQMRPSFAHLHDDEDDEPQQTPSNTITLDDATNNTTTKMDLSNKTVKQRPIMFAKKETERTVNARKNSYAYKRASEESEEWIELHVHDKNSTAGDDMMDKVECKDDANTLKLVGIKEGKEGDGNVEYVKSLNYLERTAGEMYVENLSDWSPSAMNASLDDGTADVGMADETTSSTATNPTEQAAAELAAKLVLLLQTGNGTMIPYRVLRSRFQSSNGITDEILTSALSSCAVLVRGNFCLKSNLATFINNTPSSKLMRELRDLILLLLNLHGMVQRERLIKAYIAKAEITDGYDTINGDMISFVLETVAKKSNDCWVAKVDDDEAFGEQFPNVAAYHAVYWIKKKECLDELIDLYENVE